MRWSEVGTQVCSVARSLSVIGDRWTLVILREALSGVTRFDEFRERVEASRAIVADRLAKLTEAGLLERTPYQTNPVRHEYLLTEKGRDVLPIILALVSWGDKWMDDGCGVPSELVHEACGKSTAAVPMCAECGKALEYNFTFRPGPGSSERIVEPPPKPRSSPKRTASMRARR